MMNDPVNGARLPSPVDTAALVESLAGPGAVPYGVLMQRHEEYDAALYKEVSDLYEGGYRVVRNAERYLPKLLNENDERYRERLKSAGYIGYLGQIVDYFSSALFSQELTVAPAADANNPVSPGGEPDNSFYGEFGKNVDRKGQSFAELMRCVFKTALLMKKAFVAVDAPVAPTGIETLADEEAAGLADAYAFEVPVEQIINWKRDEADGFAWAVLYTRGQPQDSPFRARGPIREEWKVWLSENGQVSWMLFRLEYVPSQPPQDQTLVRLMEHETTSFSRIPIFEVSVPGGLWVGNKVAPLNREHYQRRSTLVAAENRNCIAIPFVKLGEQMGPVGGAMLASVAQDESRGHDPVAKFRAKGFITLSAQDDIGFAEPSGASYALIDGQLSTLKDEMFRVVHQMAASVANSAMTLGRSGESKQEDGKATGIVLNAFGKIIRPFAEKLYTFVSKERGEDVVWSAHGLDEFDGDDRTEVVAEAVQIPLVGIPSKTFRQAYATQVAMKLLPDATVETKNTIRLEITAGTPAMLATEDAQKQAEIQSAKGPPKPGAPGKPK